MTNSTVKNKRLRVLIVEDSEDDLLLLLHTLKCEGYDLVYEQVDKIAAILIALEQKPWDIIICDYVMPGFMAPTVLSILKEKGLDIPFIISSGIVDEETAVTVLKQGAHDFVSKTKLSRLAPAIERELREAEVRRKQRQTEAALRENEARYRSLVTATAQVIWIANAQGEFVDDLQSWQQLTGFTTEALQGWGWLEAIHPEDRELTAQSWKQAIATQKIYEIEHRVLTAEGIYRFFIARGVPVLDESSQVREWIGTLTNITPRKRMEVALQQRAQELTTANRVKDEFLAVLSHELRTPLTPILGWSKLLQSGKLNASKIAEASATIARNAKLQMQLIDDLLDISRILHGKLSLTTTPVDLGTVLSAALDTVHLEAEAKSLQIQMAIAPAIVTVNGDAGRLQQVVWNLLSNAIKFTQEGGQIAVELLRVGTLAQIQVKDTGKGIESDFLPYVFDYFRQADSATTRKFGGLGLGLAIVRQIVQLHGGTVSVDSPGEGQGTTFTVQIPLVQSVNRSQPKPDQRVDLSGIQVLVVDDDPDSREFVAFVLKQENAIVTEAASAIEALQALERAIFDIIVSDLGMPEMDGYMLMRQIRLLKAEQGRDIPAIALSAYAGEIDVKQARAAGFQQHLSKPVAPNVLIGIVAGLSGQQLRQGVG